MKKITCWSCGHTWIYKGINNHTACAKCKSNIQFEYKYPYGKEHKTRLVVDLG